MFSTATIDPTRTAQFHSLITNSLDELCQEFSGTVTQTKTRTNATLRAQALPILVVILTIAITWTVCLHANAENQLSTTLKILCTLEKPADRSKNETREDADAIDFEMLCHNAVASRAEYGDDNRIGNVTTRKRSMEISRRMHGQENYGT